jgi:hypothetical protein
VSADVCTPPVVTFCNPCAASSVPVTSFMVPSAMSVPVTAYRWPAQTSLRPVILGGVPVSVTRVYRPVWPTVVPSVPVMTMYAPTAAAAPVTSYYAPGASAAWSVPVSTSVMTAAPVSAAGGCNCQGR